MGYASCCQTEGEGMILDFCDDCIMERKRRISKVPFVMIQHKSEGQIHWHMNQVGIIARFSLCDKEVQVV